ncbi:MAG: hypothetical protein WCP52_11230 [Bacteroidota bacterium]
MPKFENNFFRSAKVVYFSSGDANDFDAIRDFWDLQVSDCKLANCKLGDLGTNQQPTTNN